MSNLPPTTDKRNGTPLPRSLRRRLKRESDRVLAATVTHLRGTVLPVEAADVVVIARSGQVLPCPRWRAEALLPALGLPDVLAEIDEARPRRHPCDVPLVIILGSHAAVAWLSIMPLSSGGEA